VAPHSVFAFPMDESPYGVRGLAGNVRSWCSNAWTRDGEDPPEGQAPGALREVRGGAFAAAPAFCRPAGRLGALSERRLGTLGIRLCRRLTSEGKGTAA
jgi:serine/threonine-protein kinase